ncbi:DUF1684 domain-containing protein [Maribacter sp. 2-571]|uniref:DUF1684 domain-containing protein n=1 Tax=Maribacter sp. 2-571 TaxID=3417569 RepID=UPI003D34CFEA
MRVISLFLIGAMVFSCKGEKKYHDEPRSVSVTDSIGALAAIRAFQDDMNEEFKNPETSPLPDRYRKDFESLDFFEADTTYQIRARLERTPESIPFLMPTTTERTSKERVYGIVRFQLKGKAFELEVYQNEALMQEEGYADYLFLPFTDITNGELTYGGGRYLDLRIPEGDVIVLDFNRAYNPYCAYNKKYSCPLVPAKNHVDLPVRAGVRAFKGQ